jgi:hypothetical protein
VADASVNMTPETPAAAAAFWSSRFTVTAPGPDPAAVRRTETGSFPARTAICGDAVVDDRSTVADPAEGHAVAVLAAAVSAGAVLFVGLYAMCGITATFCTGGADTCVLPPPAAIPGSATNDPTRVIDVSTAIRGVVARAKNGRLKCPLILPRGQPQLPGCYKNIDNACFRGTDPVSPRV